jgi:hypothetical protein
VVHSYHGSFAIREGNYLLAFVGGSGGKCFCLLCDWTVCPSTSLPSVLMCICVSGWTKPSDVADKHVQFFDLQQDPRQRADLTRRVGWEGHVYVVPKSVEGVYLQLLVGMKHTYSEWAVEHDTGYLIDLINKLLTDQVTSRPPNDRSYTQHLDNQTLSEIHAVVFKPSNDQKVSEALDVFVKEEARQKKVKAMRLKFKQTRGGVVTGKVTARGGVKHREH